MFIWNGKAPFVALTWKGNKVGNTWKEQERKGENLDNLYVAVGG
jgi:hypothetical protein